MSPTVYLPATGFPRYPIKNGMNKPVQNWMASEIHTIKLTCCAKYCHQYYCYLVLCDFTDKLQNLCRDMLSCDTDATDELSLLISVHTKSVQNRVRLKNGDLALVYIAFLYDRLNWKSNRKLDWKITNCMSGMP